MDPGTLALATAISLQTPATQAIPAADPFRLELAIDLWMPRLEGDFTDGGAQVDVRDVDLHETEAVFAG
ncbi:MAG: hypothetical protein WCI96_03815, partial [Planctomycetota bacterium]